MTIIVSQQYLNECFSYCENGDLIWKVRPISHFTTFARHAAFVSMTAGTIAGNPSGNYLQVGITIAQKKITLFVHRVIWTMHNGEIPYGCQIDHEDTNTSNNRIANLRLTSATGNQYNKSLHCNNTSGVKGVCWEARRSRWYVAINANGIKHHVGYFETIEAATIAAQEARIKLHGEFANHGLV